MKDKSTIDPKDLSNLISFLDGYAALSIVDPQKIRRIIKRNADDSEIQAIWKDISRDVDDISSLPSESEEVLKKSKVLGILRPVLMFLVLIVFTIYFVLLSTGILRNLGQWGAYALVIGIIAAYFVGFTAYFFLNRKLTRAVNSYYQKHMGEIARQRRHIKLMNQRLIDKLAMIIRSRNYDPGKYKFFLFHDDYANINVLSEDKNQIYKVTVKGKSMRRETA